MTAAVNQQPQQLATVHKLTQAALDKENYLRELLRKDTQTPTDQLAGKIKAKFGRGLTPSRIIEIREKEFGVKYGPRGTLRELAPQPQAKMSVGQGVVSQAESSALKNLIGQARALMGAERIKMLVIPREDAVKVTYEEFVYEIGENTH